MDEPIAILFEDEALLIVNKPAGILVHRSASTSLREPAILQIMRDRTGCRLFPVHRLDRATSGVLVLAKSSASAAHLGQQWAQHLCQKTYIAIVRGWPELLLRIDHALADLEDQAAPAQSAETLLQRLGTVELSKEVDRYPKTRYSLVALQPQTGRQHQLRRHCKWLSHPIIGDTVYGRGVHNRFFREEYGVGRLMLHHSRLSFRHPLHDALIQVGAPMDEDWSKLLQTFAWDHLSLEHE